MDEFSTYLESNRLLSTIGGNREMDQIYKTSQVSKITTVVGDNINIMKTIFELNFFSSF